MKWLYMSFLLYFLNMGSLGQQKTGNCKCDYEWIISKKETSNLLTSGMMLLVKYKQKPVVITETLWKGTNHYKVKTHNAIWYIEKMSGGCSSLLDGDGRDWIDFENTGDNPPLLSSDSDFRGLPNLVFREPGDGIGHPGFDKCNTTQTNTNELLVVSKDGKWQFRWLFYATHAEIKVDKTDESRKYWFLYEGPAAGRFSPETHYWGNNIEGICTSTPSIFEDPRSGNWQWVFFGDLEVGNTLFVAQKDQDSQPDFFAYMGNNPQKQNLSADGMNVFGFGRNLKTQPALSGENHFYIGLFPLPLNKKEQLDAFEKYIEELIK